MKFGIQVGHLAGPLDDLRKLWRFADDHGFDWFSVSDHFQETPAHDGSGACLDSIATLTAAAMDTGRVRLSCLVWCIAYRQPIVLAKALTTIDLLSGGRVTCGLGTGWHEGEYRSYGIPFPSAGTREDQLEEYTQVVRLLFDNDRSDFTGEHYTLTHAPNFPRPAQRHVPIWIGGGGEKRTMRTTARYADGWNVPYVSPADWAAKNAVLDRWCERERRDPRTLVRTVNVGFYLGTDARGIARADERYAQDWSGRVPADNTRTGFFRGSARNAGTLISAYRDAGVEQLNIAVRAGPYDFDALAAFADVMERYR